MTLRLLPLATLLMMLSTSACDCSTAVAEGEGEAAAEGEGEAGEGEGEGEGEGAEGEGEGSGCAVDTDCLAGERCVDGGCADTACGSDADCGAGRVCSAGSCGAASCIDATDCGVGQSCTAGACVGAPCTVDTDCPALQVCFADGTCGSSPLQDPYQGFCTGSGTVVTIGGTGGDVCLGDIAQAAFQFGFCSCSDLVGDGSQVTTDAFNSNNGPYGEGNIFNDGHVGVNGAFDLLATMNVGGSLVVGSGDVVIRGTSDIKGDLYAFGDISTDGSGGQLPVGNDVYSGGTRVENLDIPNGELYLTDPDTATLRSVNIAPANIIELAVPAVAPCPCKEDQRVPIVDLVTFARDHNDNAVFDDPNTPNEDESFDAATWADPAVDGPGTIELACGRYYLSGINQDQGLTIHALDRTVLFVDGDFIADSLTITLADGAEVDIFVTGNMAFNSSTSLGDAQHPSAVRTYVNGQLALGASGEFGGLIYAPNADVDFSASLRVFGALFVNTATFGGNVSLHFDSAVRSAGNACVEPGEGEGEGGVGGEGEGEGGVGGEGEGEPVGGEGEGEGEPVGGGGCTACDPDNQCGTQACLGDSGAGDGVCGACATSLDCCFPQVCSSGRCGTLGG